MSRKHIIAQVMRTRLEEHGIETWRMHRNRVQLMALVYVLCHRLSPADPYRAYHSALISAHRHARVLVPLEPDDDPDMGTDTIVSIQ